MLVILFAVWLIFIKRLKVLYGFVLFCCVYATYWYNSERHDAQLAVKYCNITTALRPSGADGRTKNNGRWFSQTEPFHLYVYSAFYDDRPSHGADTHLAIIAVIDERWLQHHESLWCRLHYGMLASNAQGLVVVGAKMARSGAGTTVVDDIRLVEHVIVCPVSRIACLPIDVALAWGDLPKERTEFRVPVEVSRREGRRRDLAVCVSTSFGNIDRRKLVEWLEMQRILGVELVVMYNHSMNGPAVQILHDYARFDADALGVADRPLHVEVRQSHDFLAVAYRSSRSVYLHMSPNINDCMYRFSGSVGHFAVVDLDEVIVPRAGYRRLPDLVAALGRSAGERIGAFVFRNAYFFEDLQLSSGSDELFSTYLSHRRRLPPSPRTYSIKSIVDSEACVAMHNHYCWDFTSHFRPTRRREMEVPTDIALLHHYKRCHLDSYLDIPGICKLPMQRVVFDDVMKKYERRLSEELAARYSVFNITLV